MMRNSTPEEMIRGTDRGWPHMFALQSDTGDTPLFASQRSSIVFSLDSGPVPSPDRRDTPIGAKNGVTAPSPASQRQSARTPKPTAKAGNGRFSLLLSYISSLPIPAFRFRNRLLPLTGC
jgi:hypothetical protein